MNKGHHTRSRHSRRWVLVRGVIVAILAAGILVTSAGAIGAQSEGCGSFSYGFTGTRLLNDGISDSAGPFSIELPAGTYDITMFSNDNHPSADYQIEQTQEQWYFQLDSGYVSPPTVDVPSDKTHTTTSIGSVELEAATAISVHHLGEGGINSVNVECVGFTPSAAEVAAPATTQAPATTEQPAIQPPTSAVTPNTEAPAVVAPTTDAPSATPTTDAPLADPPATEVLAEVQTPAVAQLAVTGSRNVPMVLLGLAIIALGLTFLVVEHRITEGVSRT